MALLRLTCWQPQQQRVYRRLPAPNYDTRAACRLSDEPADGREEPPAQLH
ncbi:hypothetical protein ACFU53_01455 [Streptomyces sp. NPDC057474]